TAPGNSRLFPVYAQWSRLSFGTSRFGKNKDTSGRRLFSATGAAVAQRAAILHGWRALDPVSSRGAAAGPARPGAPLPRFSGSRPELYSRIHLHGGKDQVNGIIVVDKPEGWTSHDVVNKMRRLANTKKV